MKKREIAVIEWTDAAMHGTEQMSLDEAKSKSLVDGIAVGVVVHEDKKQITLAMDWFYNHDEFRQVASYPKSGITNITRQSLEKSRL